MSELKAGTIILGIDPGTNILGYAVIHVEERKLRLLQIDVLKMSHLNSHQQKLRSIFLKVQKLIVQFDVDEMAIEAPFYGKNVQSMLKLGRSQGIAMAAGIQEGIRISEYSPKKIKQSVTGNGNASKEQVAALVRQHVVIPPDPLPLDATDALATALCHHFQANNLFARKKYSDWGGFVKQNPDRMQ